MGTEFTKETFLKAIKTLDESPEKPMLFYGGYSGLPMSFSPDVPDVSDGEVFGSFRHVKSKKIS